MTRVSAESTTPFVFAEMADDAVQVLQIGRELLDPERCEEAARAISDVLTRVRRAHLAAVLKAFSEPASDDPVAQEIRDFVASYDFGPEVSSPAPSPGDFPTTAAAADPLEYAHARVDGDGSITVSFDPAFLRRPRLEVEGAIRDAVNAALARLSADIRSHVEGRTPEPVDLGQHLDSIRRLARGDL